MQESKLKVSRANESSILILGTGKYHHWRLTPPVASWWPGGIEGRWVRRTNSTKFRQFSYIELVDAKGKSIAILPEQPYENGRAFRGSLVQHFWIFEMPGGENESFDIKVLSSPPLTKKFRLWESWSGALSYVALQGEVIGFEILDIATGKSATYVYRGAGLCIGPPIPIKKFPKTLPLVSLKGPPNNFEAPGWMLADDFEGDAVMQSGNFAMGTAYSINCFDFAGHVDDYPGYWGHIPNLQTGHTIGLPSAGFSSGSMKLLTGPASP
jgi:hypothetical protein